MIWLLLALLAYLTWRDYRAPPPSDYDPEQHDPLHYRYRRP